MDKKSNMKQAMYEMFGVGNDQTEKGNEVVREEPKAKAAVPAPRRAVDKESVTATAAAPAFRSNGGATYLAPGTVFEGTIRSGSDIEIAGEFKGDIKTEGTVVLYSGIQGNVTAKSLKLSGCSMVGDAVVKEEVIVSQGSSITGNVTAKEVQCAGQIIGDMKIAETTSLDGTAQISGNISTSSIAVVKGAVICGGIEIKPL